MEWGVFTTVPVIASIAARVFSDKGPILICAPIYFTEVPSPDNLDVAEILQLAPVFGSVDDVLVAIGRSRY